MLAVCSEKCLSETTVNDWVRMSQEGRQLMNDLARLGQLHTVRAGI